MKREEELRLKRHRRIRTKIKGTATRPRLVLWRGLKNLNAQLIDDTCAKTLFSLSTLSKEVKQKLSSSGNVMAASVFGEIFAQKAKQKGFSKVVFDRAGYLYHGRVKAFAEAARRAGLEF